MRRPILVVALTLVSLTPLGTAFAAGTHDHSHSDPTLHAIEVDRDAGRLAEGEALFLMLQRIFEPETLPSLYRGEAPGPVRCATLIVDEARRKADTLDDAQRARFAAWLAPLAVTATTETVPSILGRFELVYETSGTNAVPLDDVAPANGVPDYVERVGAYFEESWNRTFDDLGFVAPDISGAPYRVEFRRFGAYGFTQLTDEGSAGTSIQVHNNFLNFPPNDDPEGNQWGAAKVTAAHELKHASQYANNGWTEPGLWVEVDATWVEDIVFDQVNDFYNYITFGSPISAPTSPLDAGGTGAYAECVWQHWMSEGRGIGTVVAFWNRRREAPLEPVMQSYDFVLDLFGEPIVESWVEFASWNYATGTRARAGFGYEEADRFPTAPLTATATALPVSFSGSVDRLAANFLRVEGFTTATPGRVRIEPQVPSGTPLRVRVFVDLVDGGFVVESVDLRSGPVELATPIEEIAALTLILGHGDLAQGPAAYVLDVVEDLQPPTPLPAALDEEIRFRVAAGTQGQRGVVIENAGEPGSVLDFRAAVIVPTAPAPARSIAGSSLEIASEEFEPGTTVDLTLKLTNGSVDFEWLKAVELEFPDGITVHSSTDFVGPEDRRLVTDGSGGPGATIVWTDPDGAWGNVRHGESASATVRVSFDLTMKGDVLLPYRIEGDGFGSGVDVVEAGLLLRGPTSALVQVDPVGPLVLAGESVRVNWIAGIESDVAIDLSRDGGSSWETLTPGTANDGGWTWNVEGPTTFDARLRVRSTTNGDDAGISASAFSVAVPVAWSSVEIDTGSVPAGESTLLTLRFDATSLGAGTYDAELVIAYAEGSPLLVPVQLEVGADGTSSPPIDRNVVRGARPNPFNPRTKFEFDLVGTSTVSIEVFDLRGRLVRRLAHETFEAGTHAVPWDATDDDGLRVTSGVYLYRVDLDGEVTMGKVSLVK